MSRFCVDSSVWLAYTKGEPAEVRALVEEHELVTSALALMEVADRYVHYGKSISETTGVLKFIAARAEIIAVSAEISVEAAQLKSNERKRKPKFGIVDAMHLATARSENALLLTKDTDFAGMTDVQLVR